MKSSELYNVKLCYFLSICRYLDHLNKSVPEAINQLIDKLEFHSWNRVNNFALPRAIIRSRWTKGLNYNSSSHEEVIWLDLFLKGSMRTEIKLTPVSQSVKKPNINSEMRHNQMCVSDCRKDAMHYRRDNCYAGVLRFQVLNLLTRKKGNENNTYQNVIANAYVMFNDSLSSRMFEESPKTTARRAIKLPSQWWVQWTMHQCKWWSVLIPSALKYLKKH